MHFYVVTAHYGAWEQAEDQKKPRWVVLSTKLLNGQKKLYRRRRVVRVEYRMQWGELAMLRELGRADV